MRFRKFVIEPGSYWYADKATGFPRRLDVSAADVRRWHDDGTAMLASGLSIPVPYEHQDEAVPLSAADKKARSLKNNAGWVGGYEMEGDALYSLVDIEDDDVARKIPRTIRFTSPNFDTFTDGNGKRWDGVITHLALTTRPRITNQKPFESIAAALALAATQAPVTLSSLPRVPGGLALSRAGKLVAEAGQPLRPAYPLAFSLYAGAALANADVPKGPPDKGPPPKGPPKPDANAKASPDKPATPPSGLDALPEPAAERALVDEAGDMKAADVLGHLLEMLGVSVEEGEPETILGRAIKALFEHHKTKSDAMNNNEPPLPTTPKPPATPPAAPGAPPPVRQEQPPLYMGLSLEGVADPATRAALQAALSALSNLRDNELARAQSARDARKDRLLKKLPSQAARDKLTALFAQPGAALALGDDGKVSDPLASMLDVLEAANRDLPALLTTSPRDWQEQSHPREYEGGAVTDEQAEQAADLLASRMSNLGPKVTAP